MNNNFNITENTNNIHATNLYNHVSQFYEREISNHTGNNLSVFTPHDPDIISDKNIFRKFNLRIDSVAENVKEDFLRQIHNAPEFNLHASNE